MLENSTKRVRIFLWKGELSSWPDGPYYLQSSIAQSDFKGLKSELPITSGFMSNLISYLRTVIIMR